jgi:hypothetical protein
MTGQQLGNSPFFAAVPASALPSRAHMSEVASVGQVCKVDAHHCPCLWHGTGIGGGDSGSLSASALGLLLYNGASAPDADTTTLSIAKKTGEVKAAVEKFGMPIKKARFCAGAKMSQRNIGATTMQIYG